MINAANLVLRFFLEILALVAAGYWGFATFDSWPVRILAGVGVPLLMAAAWGTFRVPGDGGPPIVTVRGPIRLALEFVFFTLAVWLLALAGQGRLAVIFAVVLVIHYAIGYKRILDFITRR
jgi:hypothetical protein